MPDQTDNQTKRICLVSGSRVPYLSAQYLTFVHSRMSHSLSEIIDCVKVIHGACPNSADEAADYWCQNNNIYVARHAADWSLGKIAGPKRNKDMVNMLNQKRDVAIVFWDGKSRGAGGVIDMLKARGIKHKVYLIDHLVW